MENKYYTPEIEELYVGFECEHTSNMSAFEHNTIDRIYKENLNAIDLSNYLTWSLEEDGLKKFIRVKYLDKEDIESLGFKFSGGKLIKNYKDNFIYKPDNYKQYNLTYTYFSNILRIDVEDLSMFEENINYLFQGVIKNKSELKRLLKQLNISEKL